MSYEAEVEQVWDDYEEWSDTYECGCCTCCGCTCGLWDDDEFEDAQ